MHDIFLLTGIKGDPEDVALRQKLYGKNVIPPKPMKPFLLLMYEALQDMTLIVLIVAAGISMGLSLYQPPVNEGGLCIYNDFMTRVNVTR